MSDLQMATELRAAAAYLRKEGWVQEHMGGGFGETGPIPACIGGAIWAVTEGGNLEPYTKALGFFDPGNPCTEWGNMPLWNDTPGRTIEEVLDRLESTALALEVRFLSHETPALQETERELVTSSNEVNK